MRRIVTLFGLSLSLCIMGCESHQAKVDKLQKEYDDLGSQYQRDCSAELVKVPPVLSPKCSDEQKKVGDAWKRLQAERAKQ
ncbi:hypothetical protein [Terriglobus albidus]|uniref:hypothetical protein n=1 Tax=Terriglobus albidus TaxID=1592106 RepID=UPI0021DFA0E8|nr:hypothetical protein [Terriglobus albidus]